MFRGGANDGFHEAIGDAIALSITPEYLKKIGLIQKVPPASADIPLLLHTALDKIAFLPFGLMIDKWRWEVFSGKVKPADYNKAWWELREKYQGVAPPVDRTEADFDPGAKYHIPEQHAVYALLPRPHLSVSVLSRDVRCRWISRTAKPLLVLWLKACGRAAGSMLKLGQSKPWPEALKTMTGQTR